MKTKAVLPIPNAIKLSFICTNRPIEFMCARALFAYTRRCCAFMRRKSISFDCIFIPEFCERQTATRFHYIYMLVAINFAWLPVGFSFSVRPQGPGTLFSLLRDCAVVRAITKKYNWPTDFPWQQFPIRLFFVIQHWTRWRQALSWDRRKQRHIPFMSPHCQRLRTSRSITMNSELETCLCARPSNLYSYLFRFVHPPYKRMLRDYCIGSSSTPDSPYVRSVPLEYKWKTWSNFCASLHATVFV